MTKWFSMIRGLAFLVVSCSSVSLTQAQNPATYEVSIENLWAPLTHGALPTEAHFSWFGGGTHNDQISFWGEGELASPGMVRMAENGNTTLLLAEFAEQVSNGNAGLEINQNHWFCPTETAASRCGDTTFEIEVNSEFPLVTLVSMLGPSPDWFVGVDSLSLIDNDQWVDEIVVDLYPYDGGTRSANEFALFGPQNTPAEPISLITTDSGQIITPQLIGRMTFTRVPVMGDANLDGVVNFLDISSFISVLSSNSFLEEADMNRDDLVSFLDISLFIGVLSGS